LNPAPAGFFAFALVRKLMAQSLDGAALDQLFDKARTHNKWQARDVPDALLRSIVEHMKWGPTSANCSPARFVFVKSQEAKARLKPHLSAGNVAKTMAAPATAVIAFDLRFYDYLPRLYPPADAKSWFAGKKEHADTTAFRNGSLQGGYFILTARAMVSAV
jgi:3-hydroxypropanoate dehydrogenase